MGTRRLESNGEREAPRISKLRALGLIWRRKDPSPPPLPQWEQYYEPRENSNGAAYAAPGIRTEVDPSRIQARSQREIWRRQKKERLQREARIRELRAKRLGIIERRHVKERAIELWTSYQQKKEREMSLLAERFKLFLASMGVLAGAGMLGTVYLAWQSMLASMQGFLATAPGMVAGAIGETFAVLSHADPILWVALATLSLPYMLATRNAAVSAHNLRKHRSG